MNDRTEVLLRFYEEHAKQARQHEDHRERFTNLLLIVTAAALGLIGAKGESFLSIIVALTLVIFGVYGYLFSLKHYERSRLHATLMKWARDAIDSQFEDANNAKLKNMSLYHLREHAKEMHYRDFPHADPKQTKATSWIVRQRLYLFWACIPLITASMGGIIGIYLVGKLLIRVF